MNIQWDKGENNRFQTRRFDYIEEGLRTRKEGVGCLGDLGNIADPKGKVTKMIIWIICWIICLFVNKRPLQVFELHSLRQDCLPTI